MRETANHTRYRCYLILFVLVALLFSVFTPCPPVVAAPVLALVPSSGPVGITITITGTVFDSYEGDIIHILFDTTEISTITIPESGSFTISPVIPANASAGLHTVGAKRETTDSTFFISAPFTVEERIISLNVTEGPIDTGITITGSGFCINKAVTLEFHNPATNNVGTVTASSSGKFSRTYVIPSGTAGNHKFTAFNDAGNTAEAFFKVIPGLVLNVSSGSPGEFLKITGSGFGSQSMVDVSLGSLSVASAVTDIVGGFTSTFIIPELATMVYHLTVRDSLGNSARVDFPVTAGATLSDDTGPVGGPVTVTGGGFTPGETVTINYDDEPIAAATADSNGDFTVTFIVPPGDGGEHTITITDGATTRQYFYSVETQPPPPPALLLPENNSIAGAFIHFQWLAVTDDSVPVSYDLEIASDPAFSDIVRQKAGVLDNQYSLAGEETLSGDAADPIYYWRVMSVDGAGNRSVWSEIRAFYLDTPAAPAIISPANEIAVDFPIQLTWEPVASLSEPVTYTLQVSRNAQFSELLIDEKGLGSQGYVIPAASQRIFNKKITYYWRVKAVDNARNSGDWSGTGSFKIISPGFPAWAIYTLVGLAAVVIALITFRLRRRNAYH